MLRIQTGTSGWVPVSVVDATDVPQSGKRPLASVGDRIEISADGLGTLTHTLVAEVAA